MRFTTLFFDLDETLYPRQSGVWEAIAERIDRYMLEILHFHPNDIYPTRTRLFQQFGTTLKGLQTVCNVDPYHYLHYVHDIPVDVLLRPNPALREVLLRYPQRKAIFTNADLPHAERVIGALGLEGCFEQVIDIHDIFPYCKPDAEAFEIALEKSGNPAPEECVLLDDKLSNLAAARRQGMYTILVGANGAAMGCDVAIDLLEDLPRVLDPLETGPQRTER
ncbi:MAG TPA: pyrimidine 5'-nucleotidase [Levilinea sp.]|nr:pyrimidine 5'-nucleotidase [Levilinea sp.]